MEEKRKKPDAATVVKAVNAAVLCLLGLGISAYLLLAPRPTQSGIENRELAKFPEFSWESPPHPPGARHIQKHNYRLPRAFRNHAEGRRHRGQA